MSETMHQLLVFYGALSVPALVAIVVTVFLYRKHGRRRHRDDHSALRV